MWLRLFADPIEIYSPGGIPNTLAVESLPYRQSARNETIASLLAMVSTADQLEWLKTDRRMLMDRRGEGVRIILELSEHFSGKRPEFRLIDGEELMLTIWATSELPQSAVG